MVIAGQLPGCYIHRGIAHSNSLGLSEWYLALYNTIELYSLQPALPACLAAQLWRRLYNFAALNRTLHPLVVQCPCSWETCQEPNNSVPESKWHTHRPE